MAKKAKTDQQKLQFETFKMFKFLGVDARPCGLTLEQATVMNERSESGDRAGVRDQLLEMGGLDKTKGVLPDLTIPTPKQGYRLLKTCRVDVRTSTLTKVEAIELIGLVNDGGNGEVKAVREKLLKMGATDKPKAS